ALTLRIANTWGVGLKNKNNGIVIGISKGYRRMRIQNGYGIENVLTDEETKQIIETSFFPSYREAEYFDGTFQGLRSLMTILEKRYK
ncbi:MAG: TPM domain-containing protein, partial [Chitinophagaceae bacterium]